MIKVYRDGRTIRTGPDYTKFRADIFERDGGQCTNCGRSVYLRLSEYDSDMHLHHINGRGMGGSKRNDVSDEVRTLCAKCHRASHQQQ